MLKDFIDAQGWEMAEYEWPDRYFFGEGVGERRLVVAEDADENDPDVREVHRLFTELPGVPIDRDVTALEWLRDIVRCSDKVLALAESIYANDFGTSLALTLSHDVDPSSSSLSLVVHALDELASSSRRASSNANSGTFASSLASRRRAGRAATRRPRV